MKAIAGVQRVYWIGYNSEHELDDVPHAPAFQQHGLNETRGKRGRWPNKGEEEQQDAEQIM